MKLFYLSIFLSLLFTTIKTQKTNDMTKAVACMTIINKLVQDEGGDIDPQKYSPMMLNCFVTIKESQIKDILSSFQNGGQYEDEQEIKRLTDSSSLPSRYKPEELMSISKRLNGAIEKFKKIQENKGGFSIEDLVDDKEQVTTDKKKKKGKKTNNTPTGLLGLGMRALENVFEIANSFGMFVVMLVGLFFSLRFLKMCCKTNKPKKKVKKSE